MSTFITLDEAKSLTFAYQNSSIASDGQTIAFFIDNENLETVMSQENAVGIRVYLGLNASGKISPVIVGVDANNVDLTEGPLLDDLHTCPPVCNYSSELIDNDI